jgi:hypothetical protein
MDQQISQQRISACVGIVWQLAAQEAVAASFSEVLPEHFLTAVLKLAELPVDQLKGVVPGMAAESIAAEIEALRKELANRGVDSAPIRQKLRSRLGRGAGVPATGEVHRAQSSRDLFVAAAQIANEDGAEAVGVIHLLLAILDSPTDVMRAILDSRAFGLGVPPVLEKHGRDLTALAAARRIADPSVREAEAKMVLQTIFKDDCKCVFLITPSPSAAASVIDGVAVILSKAKPGFRLFDLSQALNPSRLLDTTQASSKLLLFLPAFVPDSKPSSQAGWGTELKTALKKGCARCICRLDPLAYERYVQKEPEWRSLTRAIWIRDEALEGIPEKL